MNTPIIVDARDWCGDANFETYVEDMKNLPSNLTKFLKKHPPIAVVIALIALYLSWMFLLKFAFDGTADNANSYFTLLTFAALVTSVAIQNRALIKQIDEMQVVSKVQAKSNIALQEQLKVMTNTSMIQSLSAEAGVYESVERYKRFKTEMNENFDQTDSFIRTSERLLRDLAKYRVLVVTALDDLSENDSEQISDSSGDEEE